MCPTNVRGRSIVGRGHGYVAPLWIGVWARNSPNKSPYSAICPYIRVYFAEINKKTVLKMDSSPHKLIMKLGTRANVGNLRRIPPENRATDPVYAQAMYPPPAPPDANDGVAGMDHYMLLS